MSGTPAQPNVGGPWAAHRQSFQIEVPCNISRRIGVSAGQSRRLTARCHSLENDKTAGQEPLGLRLSWWPGAGSNRRPSDFQTHAVLALVLNVCMRGCGLRGAGLLGKRQRHWRGPVTRSVTKTQRDGAAPAVADETLRPGRARRKVTAETDQAYDIGSALLMARSSQALQIPGALLRAPFHAEGGDLLGQQRILALSQAPRELLGKSRTAWALLVMNRSLVRGSAGAHFARPRSTAAKYSNASDFDRSSLPSNAQIRAQTRLVDRRAPSSQRGDPSWTKDPDTVDFSTSSVGLQASVRLFAGAPLLPGMDHDRHLRRPTGLRRRGVLEDSLPQCLLTSARRKKPTLAGRSASRRMKYPYHSSP